MLYARSEHTPRDRIYLCVILRIDFVLFLDQLRCRLWFSSWQSSSSSSLFFFVFLQPLRLPPIAMQFCVLNYNQSTRDRDASFFGRIMEKEII